MADTDSGKPLASGQAQRPVPLPTSSPAATTASGAPLAASPAAAKVPDGLPRASMQQAARDLLTQRQWLDSVALARPASLRITLVAGTQATLALLVAIVLALLSPYAHVVGFAALGALAALFGRYAPLARRRGIVAVCMLWLAAVVGLTSVVSWLASATVAVLVLALVAGLSTVVVFSARLGGPGAVIFVFAAGAALVPAAHGLVVVERTAMTLAGGMVAWLVCAATDVLRRKEVLARSHLFAPPSVPPWRSQWVAAARISLGAASAALVADWAGWSYPAWAAIGATAVMQGSHLHVTMSRAMQRMAGTIVGAFVAWAVLAQQPALWQMVLAIVVLQFVTEMVIGLNYGLGQVAITPMALLMTSLATPGVFSASDLPVERVLETILGAALGLVLALLFSNADDRRYLARLQQGGQDQV